jgi:hypothetical protein
MVSVESRKLEIDYDPYSTAVSELESAIKRRGYPALRALGLTVCY